MIVSFRGGLLAVLVSLASAASPLSAQKVGYVDSRKILQEMPARVAAEARMRAGLDILSARQKKMVDSLNALVSGFERDSATLTQTDKIARFTSLQAYDAMYRDTLAALEEEAQSSQAQAMQPLFDQIKLALDDVRQADGYAMIFDIGGQSNPIVSMDRNLDISDRVLARIRAMPTTGAAPAAAAPRPAPAAAAPRPAPATPAATTRPPGPVAQPSGARRP